MHCPALLPCSGVHDSTLQLAGTTRRCLNLGSYNYLGFAAADEYCTPRVLDTMHRLGVSSCSSRAEAGVPHARRPCHGFVPPAVLRCGSIDHMC